MSDGVVGLCIEDFASTYVEDELGMDLNGNARKQMLDLPDCFGRYQDTPDCGYDVVGRR